MCGSCELVGISKTTKGHGLPTTTGGPLSISLLCFFLGVVGGGGGFEEIWNYTSGNYFLTYPTKRDM